ncbi:hypothetical protein UFOVP1299_39 [uncultured Caudovirales phage]|uniref:B30.2/SPRY domain-containing protein n=1 Tax=uncultured Caudovirales phage TaxID=2100421 RepID=A0A6J5RQF9_9CAUD|nr:hypothetical protein UFOVP1299_39 [uncultured Caudovirales phage]
MPVFGADFAFFGTAAAAAVTPTTLDPSAKGSDVTLSGGNLLWSGTGGGGGSGVRSIASHSTGRYYFEYKYTAGTSNHTGVGLANSSWDYSVNTYVGATGSCGVGLVIGTLSKYAITGTCSSTAAIDVWLGVAVDLDAKKIWFRNITSAETWNGTSADPSAGTGALDFVLTGPYFAAASEYAGGGTQSGTLNFGASAFVGAVPSGFSSGF